VSAPQKRLVIPSPSLVSLAPEAQLLLLAAGAPPDSEAISRLLRGGMDWQALGDLAEREKATTIVVGRIPDAGAFAADPGFRELRQRATLALMTQLRLEQLLHEILDTLAAEGIPVMLLKGAALAYSSYDSFPDRPMGDLDLLVRPADAERAWGLLQANGWTWPAERWAAPQYTFHHHRPPLIRDPGGLRLEIHEDVLPQGHPFQSVVEPLWLTAVPTTAGGRPALIPDPVFHLWHVCVHFAWIHEMRWGAWRALRDCAAIARRPGVDWNRFLELARDSRAASCCFWTLHLARELAGAGIPGHVLESLRPRRTRFLLERLQRHYISNLFPSPGGCPSVWLSRRLWEAGIRPRSEAHGDARPWPGEGSGARPAERRPFGARLRRLAAGVAYLGRLSPG